MRDSFICAMLVFALLICLGTELLSISGLLTKSAVSSFWLIALLIVALGLRWQWRQPRPPLKTSAESTPWSASEITFLTAIVLILTVTGVVAFVNPPNTWDSMTYHMSRVAHWVQNQSLDNYPTSIRRQNYLSPFAEFVILHLQILSQGDRFANFVQWFAVIGCLIAVSLIARQFGANRQVQILSAVVCLTIPIGALQIASTQTDYVLSFWIASAAYYTLLLLRASPRETNLLALKAASSIALSIFTKGLAYFTAFPLCLWLASILIAHKGARVWKIFAAMTALSLSINAGHFARMIALYGSPLGSSREDGPNCVLMNEPLNFATLTSSVLRNVSVDLATFHSGINTGITLAVTVIHNLLGLNASDPHTTWWVCGFLIRTFPFNEVLAGSPIHLILSLMALSACLLSKQLRARKELVVYSGVIIAGYLLLCLFNRWHPWMGRYHLPVYVLTSPLVAIVIFNSGKRIACNLAGFALFAMIVPYLLFNDLRPLAGKENIFTLSRNQQYFLAQRDLEAPFTQAAELIKSHGCRSVALSTGWDGWEYPLWVLLNQEQKPPVHIEHTQVNNVTSKLTDPSATPANRPDALIEMVDAQAARKHSSQFESQWRQTFESGPLRVYFALPPAKSDTGKGL